MDDDETTEEEPVSEHVAMLLAALNYVTEDGK
jgi:hypothetical protein